MPVHRAFSLLAAQGRGAVPIQGAVAIVGAVAILVTGVPGSLAESMDLLRLLERRSCPGCRLQDADLVHADLHDADLRQALL